MSTRGELSLFDWANTSISYGDEIPIGIEIIDAMKINPSPKLKIF